MLPCSAVGKRHGTSAAAYCRCCCTPVTHQCIIKPQTITIVDPHIHACMFCTACLEAACNKPPCRLCTAGLYNLKQQDGQQAPVTSTPPRSKQLTHEQYEALVTASTELSKTTKAGMLPKELW